MADKNLGDLIFDLALDDSKFQAAITRSIDAIKKLNNAAKGISALSVGDAGGVTGGGAARMAKEQSRGAFMRQLASFAAMTKREQADKAKAEQQAANEERKLFAGRLSAYGKMVAAEVRMKQKAEKEKADAAIREGKREQREAEIRVRQKFKLERDVMQGLMKAQAQYDREQAKLASAAMRERAKAEAAEAKRTAQRKAAADAAPGTILSTLADSGSAIASSIETAFNRITVAVAAVGTAITVLGARFEKTIGTVAVLSGGSLPELTAAARQFGTTSVFSAQEAADAMLNFAQAGMTAEENIAATGSAIKLASASGSDLSLTTSIMSDAMSQFSLTTGEAANLADIFTFALNDSKLGMNDLSVSMRYAGTVGAGFGMSVQETTAALMMFSNLGLKGSKAGTVFRLAMNSAANTTAVADKILKAYNLTQQDINPATKKFGDILKVVSDRQITVNDAMKIFGMEAGANIVALAEMQKKNEGTSKSFEGLVAGMQKATEQGLAATTAAEMMNNVADQFRLLIAKISEAGFSIYYAFSEPLKALIVEVSGVASDVLDAFGFASASIEDSVGGALTNLTAYVKDNRTEIVASVLSFIDGFGKLSAQILSLAPVFAGLVSFAMDFANAIMNVGDAVAALIPGVDSAAQVFAALFVVANVLAFAAAIQKVVTVIRDMRTAMIAAEVSAGVLTGGIGLLVAGSLALIAVLADYASANDAATDSVNNLFAAEEHRRQVNDKAYAAELARIDELLNATRARATEVLKGGKGVTDEQKREAESLLRLTKEQAAAEIRAGRLVAIKGQLATASQVVAMKANGEATAIRAMYKQQEMQEKAAVQRLEMLRKAKIDADKAAKAAGGSGAGGISRATIVTTMAQTIDNGEIQSAEELALATKDAEKALEQIREQSAAFGRELTIAESKTKKTTAALSPYNKSLGESAKQEAKAAREAAALADEFERLSAAAMEYYERSKAALVETPFPKAKELEDQIATMRDAFQKAIDYGEENGQDTIALQARVIFTERNMRLAAAKEAARDAELAANESVSRLIESQQTEQEKRDAARAKELEDARVYFNQLLVLADADADEYGRVVQAKREKQKAINDFYNAADLAAEEEYQAKLAEMRRSTAEKFTAEVEAIEAKGMTAAAKIRQDASDKVKRIIDDEVKAYRDANKEREVSDIEAMMVALEALARNKEAAAAIFADAEKEAKKVETPFEKLKRTVIGIFGEDAGKALDNLKKKFEEMGGVGKRIAQIIAKVFKGAFGVIKGGFDVVMGVVQQISGFSLNILGTIQDAIGFVQSEQKAAIEDASARAKAAGFDPAMAERRAAAATRPDDLATKFVDNLVGGAVRITQLFVAVVGPVISELAAQLPSLFTAVANAIPQIVTAFAQNIGPLVAAIVDGVPKVAIALIEAIPTIAQALIEAILYDLLPAIPEIAWSLVTSIWTALWETLKAAGGAIGGWIGSLFDGGGEGGPAAYSGMDYVPSTMRATLHQGEAVIPADRNARRLRGATAPAPAGADQNYGGRGGMGGFGPLEVAVIAEGRLLEAVQMRAEDMGRATGMGKRIRKAAGVKVGFSRGDYNPWSR